MNYSFFIARAAACAIFPVAALAQPAPSTQSRPNPTDASTPIPPLRYESPLADYRLGEDEVSPAKEWRSLNDLVGKTGGMSSMEGMDHGAMERDGGVSDNLPDTSAQSQPLENHPSESKTPSGSDGTPGMDPSSGGYSHHHQSKP